MGRVVVVRDRGALARGLFYAVWWVIVVVPVLALLVWPFIAYRDYHFVLSPSLDAVTAVLASGRFEVALRTLRIAATVTLIELAAALPFALWLARSVRSPLVRSLFLAGLTIPFFLSLASRTIVWRAVLGTHGLVNTGLLHVGLIDQPLDWLLFSEFAVHLGLLGPSFPTMVLPIYLAVTLVDDEIFEAAADLGAGPWRTFVDVVLPLIVPGILAGVIFTFVPILGETVVPGLLGGGRVALLGASITSLIGVLNYPVAAALGAIVLVVCGLLLVALRVLGRGRIDLADVFERVSR